MSTQQASEPTLKEWQAGAANVIEFAEAAYQRGELGDAVAIGFRLTATVHAMKRAHQAGARKIAREYAEQVGIDFDLLDQQVGARIYEHVQISRLEAGLS